MWRCSLRSSRSVSCCRPCAGEWGWTLQWIQICLWALEPPWWVLPIRSNRTSSTIRNPSLPTHWGDLMPMTHKCWCGGRGGERRLWLSHPNNIEWLIMVVLPSYRGNEGGSEAKSERERERETLLFPCLKDSKRTNITRVEIISWIYSVSECLQENCIKDLFCTETCFCLLFIQEGTFF